MIAAIFHYPMTSRQWGIKSFVAAIRAREMKKEGYNEDIK
ncbi:Hypothetical protein ABZS17G119_01338 [Kosakonia cowanii]